MTNSITERITLAEKKWIGLVQPHTAKIFSDTFIPSHDHKHHRRVWNICKELLIKLEKFNSVASQDLVEGILLAAWFHDTGMARDSGIRHGALSRKMFESYISKTDQKKPEYYSEVLDAIEYHDTKERSAYPDMKPGVPPGILGILSIADDLDALGNIGIYRYSEIYLKRGIPIRKLGTKILTNVQNRFENIQESCSALPGLTEPYLESYHIIEKFFKLYEQQLMLNEVAEVVSWQQVGIVNLIRRFSVESEIRPENFRNQTETSAGGEIVINYFNTLHDELELANC